MDFVGNTQVQLHDLPPHNGWSLYLYANHKRTNQARSLNLTSKSIPNRGGNQTKMTRTSGLPQPRDISESFWKVPQ